VSFVIVIIYRKWCVRENGVYDVLPGLQFCVQSSLCTRTLKTLKPINVFFKKPSFFQPCFYPKFYGNYNLTELCIFVYLYKDTDNEEKLPLTRVSIDEILDLQREEQMQRQHSEELKKKAMLERGLVIHSDPIQDDFYWL